MQGVGLLVLRLVLGLMFLLHGLPKLVSIWGTNPRETAQLFENAGVVPAYPIAVGSGLVEVLGGGLLLVGGYTIWASLLLVMTTGVVAWTLSVPAGFYVTLTMTPGVVHGDVHALLVVGALVCLLCCGPGRFSADRRRARVAEARKLGREVRRAGAT